MVVVAGKCLRFTQPAPSKKPAPLYGSARVSRPYLIEQFTKAGCWCRRPPSKIHAARFRERRNEFLQIVRGTDE
jgi:hypothetical protein